MYICQFCQKAPATIHLTDIHDNVKKEVHMCEGCAASKGFNFQTTANLPQLLGLAAKNKAEQRAAAAEAELVCPTCGTKWSDFKAKGRLGCPDDYKAFAAKLHPLIVNQLPATQHAGQPLHVGKTPGAHRPRSQLKQAIRRRERELRLAVAGERYEDAARLKAELEELKSRARAEDETLDA